MSSVVETPWPRVIVATPLEQHRVRLMLDSGEQWLIDLDPLIQRRDASLAETMIKAVTGTRAENGLLRWVMEGIRASQSLELQTIATGTHLSPEFGLTFREIEADGFRIDRKVEVPLSSDTPVGVTKSMGVAMLGLADALAERKPDLLVVLGDRYEIFAAAAALIARIPIAHLHGGEMTEGAVDEAMRHSITKMSRLHFVAAEGYRQRVIQLGEDPERVFLVGGLGIDNIRKLDLLGRPTLEAELDFKLGPLNLLITFQPVTLEQGTAADQMAELLAALEYLDDTHLTGELPDAIRQRIETADPETLLRWSERVLKADSLDDVLR